MGNNLVKGQNIDLRKNQNVNENNGKDFDLKQVTIGLGWDISRGSGTFDLDAVAVLLDRHGKIADRSDIVYYGEKQHHTGKVWSTGDNLTGAGEGDDEQIIVKLDELDSRYERLAFFVSIYQGHSKNQHFGKVENAFIRAVDGNGNEIARYNISGSKELNDMCSFVFCEVYRKDGTWKMKAVGDALSTDSLMSVIESKYR
jgi:stress response protein SCP2